MSATRGRTRSSCCRSIRKTGDLKEIEKITVPGITKAGGSIPMAVSPNKKFLYAGFRGEPLVAAAFAIDAKTGKLQAPRQRHARALDGLYRDRSHRQVPAQRVLSGTHGDGEPDRRGRTWCRRRSRPWRTCRTPTRSSPINRTSMCLRRVSDLDQISQFKFDAATGTLTPNEPPAAKTAEKSGPRHFRLLRQREIRLSAHRATRLDLCVSL